MIALAIWKSEDRHCSLAQICYFIEQTWTCFQTKRLKQKIKATLKSPESQFTKSSHTSWNYGSGVAHHWKLIPGTERKSLKVFLTAPETSVEKLKDDDMPVHRPSSRQTNLRES